VKQLTTIAVLFAAIEPLAIPQVARASLTPIDRVNEVSQWFTGNFDNTTQVSRNPSIPLVPLSTCAVQLQGSSLPSGTQNLYLAQPTLSRFRLYSFEPSTNGVNLSIRSFVNQSGVSSICDLPTLDRVVISDNLAAAVCSLSLAPANNSYIGNNSPDGCATRTGGKVISSITFQPNNSVSLDLIYNSSGQLLVGTQIEYQRTVSVPEPSNVASLLLVCLGLALWKLRLPSTIDLHKVLVSWVKTPTDFRGS
jgi:hypothetical protein